MLFVQLLKRALCHQESRDSSESLNRMYAKRWRPIPQKVEAFRTGE
jgi:hypothetical protein